MINAENGSCRLIRRALLALSACAFLVGLTACNTRLTESDHREECKNLKSCWGEDEFNQAYSSIEDCVDDGEMLYNELEGECRKKYARAVNCFNRNFQCKNGEADYSECQDQVDAFEEADCSFGNQ